MLLFMLRSKEIHSTTVRCGGGSTCSWHGLEKKMVVLTNCLRRPSRMPHHFHTSACQLWFTLDIILQRQSQSIAVSQYSALMCVTHEPWIWEQLSNVSRSKEYWKYCVKVLAESRMWDAVTYVDAAPVLGTLSSIGVSLFWSGWPSTRIDSDLVPSITIRNIDLVGVGWISQVRAFTIHKAKH